MKIDSTSSTVTPNIWLRYATTAGGIIAYTNTWTYNSTTSQFEATLAYSLTSGTEYVIYIDATSAKDYYLSGSN